MPKRKYQKLQHNAENIFLKVCVQGVFFEINANKS